MPNGKPGDHPLTDILFYGASSYPDDIDELVKQIADLSGFKDVRDTVAKILWDDWPSWQDSHPNFYGVRRRLREIQRELESQ